MVTRDTVSMQSLALFRVAVEDGHFGQQQWEEQAPPPPRLEINLHAMTAGVAMLSLYSWLVGLKAHLTKPGSTGLPGRLAVVTDKGKTSKEQGNLVVKEAVAAMMHLWEAPFRWAFLFLNQKPYSSNLKYVNTTRLIANHHPCTFCSVHGTLAMRSGDCLS